MLKLADYRAVLAGAAPAQILDCPGVRVIEKPPASHAVSAAAEYAIAAVEELAERAAEAALYTISGSPGSCLHLFDAARKDSPDGRLVGPGFGRRRSRRIHPFALLLSLRNQVPASLSLHFHLRGPSLSTIDSAAAFADLIPAAALEIPDRPVLFVLSSASDRAEERSRNILQTGASQGLEGAIALLFSGDGELGTIARATGGEAMVLGASASSPPAADWPFSPCLEPGLGILWALSQGVPQATFEIREPGRSSYFSWNMP